MSTHHKSNNTHFTTTPPIRRRTKNPSFSSTLLDSIYRSIDEEFPNTAHQHRHLDASPSAALTTATPTTKAKHNYTRSDGVITNSHNFLLDQQEKTTGSVNLRRAIMIEDWMDQEKQKQETQKKMLQVIQPNSRNDNDRVLRKIARQKSVPPHHPKLSTASTSSSSRASSSFFFNTSTSSSSRYGCGQPGTEADFSAPQVQHYNYNYNNNNNHRRALRFPNFSRSPANTCLHFDHHRPPPKRQGRRFITNTKSRALKIYDELKQPISPGGKIANFLNSIFTPRRHNVTVSVSDRESKTATNCDPAPFSSSSSRSSCLNNRTTSARGKSSCSAGGGKRSVRFYPLSVIVDEDSRPCGHKCLQEDDPKLVLKFDASDFERMLSHRKASIPMYSRNDDRLKTEEEEMQLRDAAAADDDSDDNSHSSSDLFELDNLSSIGIGSYNEELPVYGTTSFETNQAIANGLIV